jgi:hypothetical protein
MGPKNMPLFSTLFFELAWYWFAGGRGKADFSTPLLTKA